MFNLTVFNRFTVNAQTEAQANASCLCRGVGRSVYPRGWRRQALWDRWPSTLPCLVWDTPRSRCPTRRPRTAAHVHAVAAGQRRATLILVPLHVALLTAHIQRVRWYDSMKVGPNVKGEICLKVFFLQFLHIDIQSRQSSVLRQSNCNRIFFFTDLFYKVSRTTY